MRKLKEDSIVLATHNNGKVEEMQKLLERFSGMRLYSSSDFNLEEPEEIGKTYLENARIKAEYTCNETGLVCLSDDSGIEVNDLNGEPGVYTADWSQKDGIRNFDYAMKRVWEELNNRDAPYPRKAQFRCTLVLMWPDNHAEVFEGTSEGTLIWPGRGKNGHGFDPMFIPKDYSLTYGEMDRWYKNSISHRAKAFRKMIDSCF